jgi:hypothetical protein
MHMKKFHHPIPALLFLLALLPLRAGAQEEMPAASAVPDTVSIPEMAEGFFAQYVEQRPAQQGWQETDVVYFGELRDSSVRIDGGNSTLTPALCVTPGLKLADGLRLPPSVYLWVYEFVPVDGIHSVWNTRDRLYWLRPVGEDNGGKGLGEKLATRYGSVLINDTLRAVPARWYNGPLACLGTPVATYGFHRTGNRLHWGTLRDGRIETSPESRDGNIYAPRGSLAREARDITSGSMLTAMTAHGKFASALRRRSEEQALRLLALKLNDELRRTGKAQVWEERKTNRAYTLLFYMDSTHKTHLQPLFPQDLDADDHRLLDELAGALAEQPPGILSEQWTIDGRRFAGCYVKAQCIHGKWHFTAYPRPYSY